MAIGDFTRIVAALLLPLAAASASAQLATKGGSGDAVKQSVPAAPTTSVPATRRTTTSGARPTALATKRTVPLAAPRGSTAATSASASKVRPTVAAGGRSKADGSCASNDAIACFKLGESFNRGTGADPAKAFAAFSRSCDLGIAEACFIAGSRQQDGNTGRSADRAAAAQLYRKGCEGGVAKSCQQAGNLTLKSEAPLALAFYDRACALGDGESCRYIGEVWASGVAPADRADGPRAWRYGVRGCDLGNGEACALASAMAGGGNGMPRDDRAVSRYATVGCNVDFWGACKQLGFLAAQDKDYISSRKWYDRACHLNGEAESCKARDDLDRYLANVAAGGAERARYDARQAAGGERIGSYLSSGRYNAAMEVAVVDLGSSDQASRVLEAADNAGRLSDIAEIHFYSLDGRWPDITPRAKSIVSAEIRRRTAAARAQAGARLTQSYGSYSWAPSSTSSSSSSSSSASTSTYVSESSVYQQARERAATSYCNAGWGCR